MNRLTLLAVAAGLSLGAYAANPTGNVAFELRADSTVCKDAEIGYVAHRYSVMWPTALFDCPLDSVRQAIVVNAFGEESGNLDKAVAQFMDSETPENPVAATFDELRAIEEPYTSFDVNVTVDHLSPQLLVMCTDIYEYYKGAAHGMYGVDYVNYSTKLNRILTAENMFRPEAKPQLLAKINEVAHELYDSADLPGEIEHVGSVRITDSHVVIIYQPYEIATFAAGLIELPIERYVAAEWANPDVADVLR
jgi:hypothetical protein